MNVAESVLCLEILRNMINLPAFPLLRRKKHSIGTYSILILSLTDFLITGYLLIQWACACLEDWHLNRLSLRFMAFQNQMYNSVLLLLPGLLLSEGLCSAWSSGPLLPLLNSLFTLSCWVVGASYGSRDFLWGVLKGEHCLEWGAVRCHISSCLTPPYLPDALLPSIALLLAAAYICSRMGHAKLPHFSRVSKAPSLGLLWPKVAPFLRSRVSKATSWGLLWLAVAPFLCSVAPFWWLSGPLILGLDSLLPTSKPESAPRWAGQGKTTTGEHAV
ncbi:uncharacterized protein LOC115456978 [Microcaecilia unicolor]|uniref:Uncharacterized protein LOC115456978 n=1 Tax=Microcaecilia unicolor TaxID=1415580 RepID=A0A6P7WMG5_9AMPH|nr:uncharacterized protein LOC115456978 [Microcaecilia unicolor]XP_030042262.1 uncharacterized protein LOC115456978 [Microcaecilia unicolor]